MFKLICLFSLTLLAGCTSLPNEQVKDDPKFIPFEPDHDVAATGSLFQANFANNLYSDIKRIF